MRQSYFTPKFFDCKKCIHWEDNHCKILTSHLYPPKTSFCAWFSDKDELNIYDKEKKEQKKYERDVIYKNIVIKARELSVDYFDNKFVSDLTEREWINLISRNIDQTDYYKRVVRSIRMFGSDGIPVDCINCGESIFIESPDNSYKCPICNY